MNMMRLLIVLVLCAGPAAAQSWQSALLKYGANGKLVYTPETNGIPLPDFSYAGYRNGNEPIPDVPVVKTIGPVAGDNTASIQAAVNAVAAMPLNASGIRGALLLTAGMYRVSGTIAVNASGIVLRGVGQGSDTLTNTVIFATGDTPHQRSVLLAGGGVTSRWKEKDPLVAQQNVTSDTIRVGSRSFTVENASQYKAGDNIILYHPCSEGWLKAVNYGDPHSGEGDADSTDVPWAVGSYPIVYNRNITAVSGNTITVDVPFFYTLVRSLSQSYIYKYARTNLMTKIGIENLRVDIQAAGSTYDVNGNEDHAWQAIELRQLEDSWVRNCTMLHFGQSGVITNTATRITVESCTALDPISIITGERRYNFQVYTASQQILFRNCAAVNGRHHYVSNGTTYASGVVFLDCTSSGAYASSEGHRSWSQGLLWDNQKELDGPRSGVKILLGMYNRGYYGTSHGWGTVNCVTWNCRERTGVLLAQKPPTGQNFAIGCFGTVTGKYPTAPFDHPEGYIEGTGKDSLNPRSLYLGQLADRQTPTSVAPEKKTPLRIDLPSNYPNPFNPSTTILYYIEDAGKVSLELYDVAGRKMAVLFHGYANSGGHTLLFSAPSLASGTYLVRLTDGSGHSVSRKIMLTK